MKKIYNSLFIIFLCLTFINCGSTAVFTPSNIDKTQISNAKSFRLSNIYASIEKTEGQEKIIEALKASIIDEFIKIGYKQDLSNPDFIISGELIRLNEGDAGLRYIGGIYGLGKGEMKLIFEFKNNNGNLILDGYSSGQIKTGNWGGDIKKVCEKISIDLAKKFKSYQLSI